MTRFLFRAVPFGSRYPSTQQRSWTPSRWVISMTLFQLALIQGGCAHTPGGESVTQDPVTATAPESAPTPFTEAQIRAGCPVGRVDVYRITAADGQTMERRTSFVAADEERATFESVGLDENGSPVGEADRGSATWAELRDHARYPAAQTTVVDAEVTVPAGTFAVRLYEVREGERITRAWFAPELPGPPIRHEMEEAGRLVSRMELVSHQAP